MGTDTMWNFTKKTHIINKSLPLILAVILLCSCSDSEITTQSPSQEPSENYSEPTSVEKEEIVEVTFKMEEIPEDVKEEMMGVTISEKSKMGFDDLSYLTLTYVGYDGKTYLGNMIVDKKLADEVLLIFEELYEAEFPIECIEPMYKYNGDDELSMESNNTSSFNDRPVTGGTGLSYHQLGRAIDINPYVNPYVKKSEDIVLPASAEMYTDRKLDEKGMIKADGICVNIFKKYGWTWGGDWTSLKDYQHFEKR